MSEEDQPVITASILEMMQAMVSDFTTTITNNHDSLRAEINNNNAKGNDKFKIIQAENAASREKLLTRINDRSRLSSRVSSRTTSSKQLALGHAVILTATIPVVTVPIIVTVLKTPPLCFAVPDNETITTHMEPILSATNITVLESPQQPLDTMIAVPVRTTTAPSDITPSSKSSHASDVVPTDDSPSMDADDFNDQHVNSTHQPEQPCFTFNSDNSNCTSTQVHSDNSRRIGIDVSYESEQDDLNNFNNQHTNSTLQLEHPYPIIIAGNFINNKYGCCSGDCNATSYIDWGTAHVPMAMVLVS